MELGIHIINQGNRFREIIEITKGINGRKDSRTIHQEKVNDEWRTRQSHKQLTKLSKPRDKRQGNNNQGGSKLLDSPTRTTR